MQTRSIPFARITGLSLTAVALSFIGLLVGVGCVLLPSVLPLGILALSGLLLLWVMPDLQRLPERLASATLIPFVVTILSVPNYYGLILPGLPWISVRRLAYGIFASAVVVMIAGSSAKRSELAQRLRAAPTLTGATLAYFACLILATPASVNLPISINTTFNEILFEFVPFIAVVLLVKTERQILALLITFVVCVFIDLAIGGVEFRLQHPYLVNLLPSEMRAQIADSPGLTQLFVAGRPRDGLVRSTSIFNTPLSWSEMSAMLTPASAYLAFVGKRWAIRMLGSLGVISCLLCIYMSGSRGGYVCFIAGLIFFAVLNVAWLVRNKPQATMVPLAVCLCAIVAVSTVSSVVFVGRIHRIVLGGGAAASSTEARSEQWALAKPKIAARPVLGYGPGVAVEVVGWSAGGFSSLDSYAISLLVGVGIPGFVAFFAIFLFGIYHAGYAFLTSKHPLASYGLAAAPCLLSFTLYRFSLSQADNNTLAFVLAGLVICIIAGMKAKQPAAGTKIAA